MRTTITLEDDVVAALKRLGTKRKLPFKDLVNTLLREGIKSMSTPGSAKKKFVTKEVNLGKPRFADVDNIGEVLAVAENESFR
jgi:hypothetical protein